VIDDQRSITVERHAGLAPVVAAEQDALPIDDHPLRMMVLDLPQSLVDVDALRLEEPCGMGRAENFDPPTRTMTRASRRVLSFLMRALISSSMKPRSMFGFDGIEIQGIWNSRLSCAERISASTASE